MQDDLYICSPHMAYDMKMLSIMIVLMSYCFFKLRMLGGDSHETGIDCLISLSTSVLQYLCHSAGIS